MSHAFALRARIPRWTLMPLAVVLGPALVLGGLIGLGQWAREQIRDQDRYTFRFPDIDCTPPPGQERQDFLDEVQYLAGLPEQLHLLDEDLRKRLAEAFAQHPWVEKVDQVVIEAPRQVHVRLTYRTPVLAVTGTARKGLGILDSRLPGREAAKNFLATARAVDKHGILLPRSASMHGLPVLSTNVQPAAGPSGTSWGDARVEIAARTADYLRPYQERLPLQDLEATKEGLILSTPPGVRVLWGSPPGAEQSGEASAAQKVDRLLGYCKQHGNLSQPEDWQRIVGYEHDVRPQDQAMHRPLPLPRNR
jgi:hypothetical protein